MKQVWATLSGGLCCCLLAAGCGLPAASHGLLPGSHCLWAAGCWRLPAD